jgi:hypothetical protein
MNALPRLETRHWWGLGLTLLFAFTILGFVGREVYRHGWSCEGLAGRESVTSDVAPAFEPVE